MQTAQRPVATHRPVEPLQPFPAAALDAAVQRRAGALTPPQISSSDFDITFLTPVSIAAAQNSTPPANTRTGRVTDFGSWSDYFADVPPVLRVRGDHARVAPGAPGRSG